MTSDVHYRVILVDDNELVRKSLRLFVTHIIDNMVIVGEASTGLEAVQLCRELCPDLVLMDLVMPLMNGIEATQRILHDNPSTSVLGLTSEAQDSELVQRIISAGAIGCISKQSSLDDLTEALKLHFVLSPRTARTS